MLKTIFFILTLSVTTFAGEYGIFAADNGSVDLRVEKIRRATVAIIKNEDLVSDSIFTIGQVYNFCSEHAFSKEFANDKLWANCSGVLVAKNIVLTAGHCITRLEDCSTKSFVFDFLDNSSLQKVRTDQKQVYTCKKILDWSRPVPNKQLVDFALIQLDREVTDRDPISLTDKSLKAEQDVFSFGFPLGSPMKISKGFISYENAQENQLPERSFYRANMSTHPGLSGGGVYDENLQLVGVLVRGEANIEKDGRCQVLRHCEKGDCTWAEVQKLPVQSLKGF